MCFCFRSSCYHDISFKVRIQEVLFSFYAIPLIFA
nr:MAG TPA: hypothetical protein [Caudoviricetes sp.]